MNARSALQFLRDKGLHPADDLKFQEEITDRLVMLKKQSEAAALNSYGLEAALAYLFEAEETAKARWQLAELWNEWEEGGVVIEQSLEGLPDKK